MTDWMMAEYKALKDEIAQKLKLQNDLLTFAVTTSIGLGLWASPPRAPTPAS